MSRPQLRLRDGPGADSLITESLCSFPISPYVDPQGSGHWISALCQLGLACCFLVALG